VSSPFLPRNRILSAYSSSTEAALCIDWIAKDLISSSFCFKKITPNKKIKLRPKYGTKHNLLRGTTQIFALGESNTRANTLCGYLSGPPSVFAYCNFSKATRKGTSFPYCKTGLQPRPVLSDYKRRKLLFFVIAFTKCMLSQYLP